VGGLQYQFVNAEAGRIYIGQLVVEDQREGKGRQGGKRYDIILQNEELK
jgi:hypothetical protein